MLMRLWLLNAEFLQFYALRNTCSWICICASYLEYSLYSKIMIRTVYSEIIIRICFEWKVGISIITVFQHLEKLIFNKTASTPFFQQRVFERYHLDALQLLASSIKEGLHLFPREQTETWSGIELRQNLQHYLQETKNVQA